MTPASRIRAIALAAAIGLLGAVGATVGVRPAIASECPDSVEPSRETRRYENTELGFAFQIPANYRAMRWVNFRDGISIVNPSTYDCIRRIGPPQSAGWFWSVDLTIEPVPAGRRSLERALRAVNTFLVNEPIQIITIDGKEVARYTYFDDHDSVEVVNLAFFTPDRRRIVTLSGPEDDPVLQRAIATLELR
jgi:hypothetical protein